MPQVFKSKVDVWFVLVIVGMLILLAGGWAVAAANPVGAAEGVWIALAVATMSLGLPIWMLLTTSYTIEGDTLTVRCGAMNSKVPLRSVTGITSTSTIVSAPALSLDRLEIRYGKGERVIVSPKAKGDFLKAVMAGGVAAGNVRA